MVVASDPQTSDTVLLVRPACFAFHEEAAQSNRFARKGAIADLADVARAEFDGLASALQDAGVDCVILDDTPDIPRPDAVFPNNWVSFHADGTMVLYPMATAARRLERNVDGLESLIARSGFEIRRIVDLSFHERHGHFLEGTGSLILDRPSRRAYACRSPRTDPAVVADFDDRLDYSTFVFEARDRSGQPIYHTNVLMTLGTKFAILCGEAVSEAQRDVLIGEIEANGRSLIDVSYAQLGEFVCNAIEVRSARTGDPVIALSTSALASLRRDQVKMLEGYGSLVAVPIPTIEQVGGGSVRCMIADVHLPRVSPSS